MSNHKAKPFSNKQASKQQQMTIKRRNTKYAHQMKINETLDMMWFKVCVRDKELVYFSPFFQVQLSRSVFVLSANKMKRHILCRFLEAYSSSLFLFGDDIVEGDENDYDYDGSNNTGPNYCFYYFDVVIVSFRKDWNLDTMVFDAGAPKYDLCEPRFGRSILCIKERSLYSLLICLRRK